jgi:hypothetical protein
MHTSKPPVANMLLSFKKRSLGAVSRSRCGDPACCTTHVT